MPQREIVVPVTDLVVTIRTMQLLRRATTTSLFGAGPTYRVG